MAGRTTYALIGLLWGSFTMTSANDIPGGDFDERLAQALDAALTSGEQLVAQETGDQGQAIALTKSRILVAKAGFAATGELDGHKVSAFDLQTVTSVNLRKGPLGAVIQICAEGSDTSAQNGTPGNVVVFSGPGRVKRAEAFAAQIEFLTGTQVNRVEPSARPAPPAVHASETSAPFDGAQDADVSRLETPTARKGGRQPKSLAEEIYNEVVDADKSPVTQDLSARAEASPQAPVESTPPETIPAPAQPVAMEYDDDEEAPEPGVEYRPNPRLPQPTRKQRGPSGVLVLLGIAGVLVLIGMAIMAPVRQSQNESNVIVDTTGQAGDKLVVSQLNAVSKYRNQVSKLMAKADAEAAGLRSAIRSGNKAAAKAIGEAGKTDLALKDINALSAPPGLAEAKGNLTSGLLTQKTAITAAAAAAQTGSVPAKDTLSRLDEASTQIRRAMSAISQAQSQLQKQAARFASSKHK